MPVETSRLFRNAGRDTFGSVCAYAEGERDAGIESDCEIAVVVVAAMVAAAAEVAS